MQQVITIKTVSFKHIRSYNLFLKIKLLQLLITESSKSPSLTHFMDLTIVGLIHSFLQDVDVDFEPLLLASAGLCAFLPVVCRKSLFHPVLLGNFFLDITVIVVDHPAVQQTHRCELMDALKSDRFGEGGVDVREGVFL